LFFLLFLPLIVTPTPDVFASSFIFLIAERLLRCETRGRITWRDGLTLGILFALAYFAKGILLYFGIVALGMAAVDKRLSNRRALLASSIVLVVIVAPWVVALHHAFGRWTLGFTGQLNYAWFIDGTQTVTYPGPIGAPLPYFPGNRVFNQPAIYAVQTKPNITYVPWYDPARFDQWDHAYFQWRGQIAAIQKNLVWFEAWLLVNVGAMSVVVLAVILISGRAAIFRRYWIIVVPTLAVLTMYVLVYIRTSRYVVALAVLLFALALASVRTARANQFLVRAILAAGLIVFATTNFGRTLDAIANLVNHNPDPTVEVAEALHHLGIHPNSHIGTVGTGLYAYWAHLARVNVAAEIWDDDAPLFWSVDSSRRGAMLCAMSRAGASAVVGLPPANADLNGWEPLGKSGYWLRRVSPEECGIR